MLAEMEQILNALREEIESAREKNRECSRNNRNDEYAQNTMYMVGIYKAMSITSDFLREELKTMDKWADEEEDKLSD